MEIGLGQVRLSPDDFWGMTLYEFLCMQKGFYDWFKVSDRQDWHRTIELINIQLPKGKKINADAIFNERAKPKKVSMDERMKSVKRLDKLAKKHGISKS